MRTLDRQIANGTQRNATYHEYEVSWYISHSLHLQMGCICVVVTNSYMCCTPICTASFFGKASLRAHHVLTLLEQYCRIAAAERKVHAQVTLL